MPSKTPQPFHFADNTCLLNVKQPIKEINKSVNKYLKSLLDWHNADKMLPKLK